MYPWCSKAPDICNKLQNEKRKKIHFTDLKAGLNFFFEPNPHKYISFFFLLTGGWCEKKGNAREATAAGKRKSRIITSGAVGPYEPWEAVTGTCHTLSVAIAVVRALGDGICEQGRKQRTINSSSGGHIKGKLLKIPQWTTWTWGFFSFFPFFPPQASDIRR